MENSERGSSFARYNTSDHRVSLVTIGDDIYALKDEVHEAIPNGDFAKNPN